MIAGTDESRAFSPEQYYLMVQLNVKPWLFQWVHFGLGLLLLLICLSACANTHAKSPPTATPLPTPTGIPTFTPVPKATPTAVSVTASCPLPDLFRGSHISARSSYTETQTEAVGAPVCRIERDSCAFYRLVGNLDAGIIVKQEEEPPYDGEDILMHPAMLLPLFRLNELIEQEWDGAYQLRITDAYDSLLEHHLDQPDEERRVSLHFEGRALDLTTWPIEPALYGRLCILAHCAGFEWVDNEGDHCHVAKKAESLCNLCE